MLAMEQRKSVEELMLQRDDSPARGDATPVIPYIAVDEPQIRATTPGSGVDSLVHEMRPEAHFDLAVVDHLQSLVTDNKPLDEQLASAVRQLKALALQSNSAVLLVSHCHVDRSRTPVPRPSLADFGAHGAVQQQSDAVLGLYREEMYENARGIDGATELHILKNRHGGIGYVDLFFYKQWLRFEDMVDP
jgi:replicative DNA helicase